MGGRRVGPYPRCSWTPWPSAVRSAHRHRRRDHDRITRTDARHSPGRARIMQAGGVVERVNIRGIAPPRRWVHAVRTTGEPLVFISGMVAERLDGSVPQGLEAQTQQVYENLGIALDELRLRRECVVKETMYIVRWTPEMR